MANHFSKFLGTLPYFQTSQLEISAPPCFTSDLQVWGIWMPTSPWRPSAWLRDSQDVTETDRTRTLALLVWARAARDCLGGWVEVYIFWYFLVCSGRFGCGMMWLLLSRFHKRTTVIGCISNGYPIPIHTLDAICPAWSELPWKQAFAYPYSSIFGMSIPAWMVDWRITHRKEFARQHLEQPPIFRG